MKLAVFAFPVPKLADGPYLTIYLGDAADTTFSGASASEIASAVTAHRVAHSTSGDHAVVVIDITSTVVTPANVKAGVSSNLAEEVLYPASIVDGIPASGAASKTEGVSLGSLLAGTAIGALLAQ